MGAHPIYNQTAHPAIPPWLQGRKKTSSRKSQRVGQAGKARRERQAA